MQAIVPASSDAALSALSSADSDAKIIAGIKQLGDMGDGDAVAADSVVKHLGNSSPEVAAAAAEALGYMGYAGAKYVDALAASLEHPSPKVKLAAAGALGQFGELAAGCDEKLISMIRGAKPEEEAAKVAAIQAVGMIGAGGHADTMAKLLDDASPDVQGAACLALSNMGSSDKAADIAKKLEGPGTKSAAITALANLGSEACVPYLDAIVTKVLVDPDLQTRTAALSALGDDQALEKYGDKISGLIAHENAAVRAAAALALGNFGEAAAKYAGDVAGLLKDEAEDVAWVPLQVGGGSARSPMAMRKPKCAALVAIGSMKATTQITELTDALTDADWEVRFCAVEALANFGEDASAVAGKIAMLLDDETYPVRGKACFALGMLNAEDQADKLSELLEDKAQCVRTEAVTALGYMGEAAVQYSGEMCKLLSDFSNCVRAAAAGALANLGEGGKPYASVVANLLYDQAPDVRAEAALALGRMGNYGAAFAEDVRFLEQDPEAEVREAAAEALVGMGEEALLSLQG